jgi:hypothetical protein
MTVTPDTAPDLLASLKGLDLTSADGRAGIRTLLSEIERLSPGLILQQAAGIELRRVGIGKGGVPFSRSGHPAG